MRFAKSFSTALLTFSFLTATLGAPISAPNDALIKRTPIAIGAADESLDELACVAEKAFKDAHGPAKTGPPRAAAAAIVCIVAYPHCITTNDPHSLVTAHSLPRLARVVKSMPRMYSWPRPIKCQTEKSHTLRRSGTMLLEKAKTGSYLLVGHIPAKELTTHAQSYLKLRGQISTALKARSERISAKDLELPQISDRRIRMLAQARLTLSRPRRRMQPRLRQTATKVSPHQICRCASAV